MEINSCGHGRLAHGVVPDLGHANIAFDLVSVCGIDLLALDLLILGDKFVQFFFFSIGFVVGSLVEAVVKAINALTPPPPTSSIALLLAS